MLALGEEHATKMFSMMDDEEIKEISQCEARSAIGWVVFGGLGLAAAFTLYLTPVIYIALGSLSSARADAADKLDKELKHAHGIADVAEAEAEQPGQ